jgi:hypothetical protein
MDAFATNLINTFGGLTKVAELMRAPVTTVSSWKRSGLSQSRLAHLRLIAEKEGVAVDWSNGLPFDDAAPDHGEKNRDAELRAQPDNIRENIGAAA